MNRDGGHNSGAGRTPRLVAEVPALVLGSGITALGVIRCLGRAGIPAYCAAKELDFVAFSRWCKRMPVRLGRYAKLEPYLERLPVDRAVVFACSDYWVLAAAALHDKLAARFPISQASREALEIFLDKQRLAEVLRQHHVPHPRTLELRSEDDLAGLADSQLAGSFLKPRSSQAFFARYHVKAFNIASREHALARFRQARADGLEVVLQEAVPGPPSNHFFIDGFVDRTGHICARFARRRIRMCPLQFGNSSYMTTVPLSEVAEALQATERLISAMNYRGIFSAEFKLDERDREFKLLEMNVRPWWYIEFAAQCGVDVCVMAYRDALGLAVPTVDSYAVGVNCVYPSLDLSALWKMARRRELSLGKGLASWFGAKQAVFKWDDPLPTAVVWTCRALEILGKPLARRHVR